MKCWSSHDLWSAKQIYETHMFNPFVDFTSTTLHTIEKVKLTWPVKYSTSTVTSIIAIPSIESTDS